MIIINLKQISYYMEIKEGQRKEEENEKLMNERMNEGLGQ
jgi:hypothetical protein